MHYRISQQGMTLIEVLIAGVILFLTLSSLAFVARTQMFYVERLERDTRQAYLKEFLADTSSYYIEHENTLKASLDIFETQYPWRAELIKKQAVYSAGQLEGQNEYDTGNGFLYMYQVSLLTSQNKQIAQYKYLLWKKQ